MPIKVSNEEFIATWTELGSPQAVANALSLDIRGVYYRRNKLIALGFDLPTTNKAGNTVAIEKQLLKEKLEKRLTAVRHSARRGTILEKGRVLVFSDAHFYPDDETTAYRALLECIKEYKPEIIVANGDLFDGASISRHPRIGWDSKPTVKQELEAVEYHLTKIEENSRFKSNLIWTLGNHDARYETYLAANAPQYEGVMNFSLKNHFPLWQPCYSYWINDDTVIKHSWKGGFNAGRANALNAGVNMITGHTHNMSYMPISDYRGTRYGIQTGMLANPDGEQFLDYTQDGVKDWRSGFVMLTFEKGQLLLPEFVQVVDEIEGTVQFRGKIYAV